MERGNTLGQMHRPILRALKLCKCDACEVTELSDATPDVEGIETKRKYCTIHIRCRQMHRRKLRALKRCELNSANMMIVSDASPDVEGIET